jgi:hypothetical protein
LTVKTRAIAEAMPPRKAKRAKASSKKAPSSKPAPAKKKKASAKKAAPKHVAAKKASAKKAPPKHVAAKKAPPKKASAKKAAPKVVRAKQSASKKVIPRSAAPDPKAAVSTLAREARQALTRKRAIAAALTPLPDGTTVVEAFLRDVDHPFKAEIEAVRRIILDASPKLSERIKWNAPSFFYKDDLGAFNLRATEYAHLILLFPGGKGMEDASGLLEGNHRDRREAKFYSLDDVTAKRRALEKLVQAWVELRD